MTLIEKVKSSNLKTVSFDTEKSTMTIEFRNGGRYRYYNISEKIFKDIVKGKVKRVNKKGELVPSCGATFIKLVRNNSEIKFRRLISK